MSHPATTSTASPPSAPGRTQVVEHRVDPSLHGRRARVLLVGCGGNGGRMLIRLATIDRALRALGHAGLEFTVCDGDLVEEHNCVRQPFSAADVGLPKATVLAARVGAAHGYAGRIRAVPRFATKETLAGMIRPSYETADLLVSCVDTGPARRVLWDYLREAPEKHCPHYWLDLGNGQRQGQHALGTTRRPRSDRGDSSNEGGGSGSEAGSSGSESGCCAALPTAAERWPEILEADPASAEVLPSCSSAEALRRQDLFVNDLLTCSAANLLWSMFRQPSIRTCGAFCNLETGRVVPIPVPSSAVPSSAR